jgi:hypothetical protein
LSGYVLLGPTALNKKKVTANDYPFKDAKRELRRIVKEQKQKENVGGEERDTLFLGDGGSIFLLGGSQAMLARPSDNDRIRVKTLRW